MMSSFAPTNLLTRARFAPIHLGPSSQLSTGAHNSKNNRSKIEEQHNGEHAILAQYQRHF